MTIYLTCIIIESQDGLAPDISPFEETYNEPATAIKVAGHLGYRSKFNLGSESTNTGGSTEFQKKNSNFQVHEVTSSHYFEHARTCVYPGAANVPIYNTRMIHHF